MTTTDAQDKKLANEADKSASDAKYDAKQARKAASSLDDFQKDVANLKSKIAADKSKLSSLSGNITIAYPTINSPVNKQCTILSHSGALIPRYGNHFFTLS